jgi:hypothetical protein
MENLLWARQRNSVVNAVLESGGDTTDCVVHLVKQNEVLLKRILELDGIAPRKMKVGEQTYIWHCPDDLVPYR